MKMLKMISALVLCLFMLPTAVFATSAQTAVTEYVGYQMSEADGDGNYSVRLVAALNVAEGELENYESIGFDVTLTYSDSTTKSGSFARKSVYSSIFADGLELTPKDIQLTGKYFFVLPITGLDLSDGDIQIEISTFSQKKGEAKISVDAVTLSVGGEVFAPDGDVTTYDKYLLEDGAYEYAYSAVDFDEYASVINKIKLAGYVTYSQNTIDGNLFGAYIKGEKQINIAYYPSYENGSLKVVYSAKAYLPATEAPEYERIMNSSITQIGRNGASETAPGESYVIQLEDGSFTIIDGGGAVEGDDVSLLNYLNDNKPASHDKPHVTWMFTHAHSDHFYLAWWFLRDHSDDIVLDLVCYNFPKFPIYSSADEATANGGFAYDRYDDADKINTRVTELFTVLEEKYPDTPHYNFHSGDVLYLADCKIEFLHTHEDFYPQAIDTMNKTSAVWKMSFKSSDDDSNYSGMTFLVLGDSEVGNCNLMASVYSKVLDSDIVQASHHGLNGATSALYEKITPDVLFWPIDSGRGNRVSGSNNDVWDNSANHAWLNNTAISHYYADVTTTIYTRSLLLGGEYDGLLDGEEENVWNLEA